MRFRTTTAVAFTLIVLLAAGAALFLSGCAKKRVPPPSKGVPPATTKPYTVHGKTYVPMRSARGYQEVGMASWYGPKFHGRRTSSGEIYDMESMTAAHKTLPINTWVEVTSLRNNKKVRVRVNDRGPFVNGRIIDLSKAAARDLEMIGPGTDKVRIAALGFGKTGPKDSPTSFVQPASYTKGVFTVQIGAFSQKANARRLAERLRPKWGQVAIVEYDRGDMLFHRVRVGKVDTLQKAEDLEARLRKAGFAQAFAIAW